MVTGHKHLTSTRTYVAVGIAATYFADITYQAVSQKFLKVMALIVKQILISQCHSRTGRLEHCRNHSARCRGSAREHDVIRRDRL